MPEVATVVPRLVNKLEVIQEKKGTFQIITLYILEESFSFINCFL